MKLVYTWAKGFLSLGDVQLQLDKPGITFVGGVNNDSPSESNGSGKSSLFEPIVWGLFGVTRRGLKADEVINEHQKGGAVVVVCFEKGDETFYVVRSRRYDTLGTCLRVFREYLPEFGSEEFSGTHSEFEITKGTMKDTQELIEEITGFGLLTFQKSVFFGQGDVKPFASLTDGELKIVFEQSLNLTKLSEDAAKVGGYRKAQVSEINAVAAEIDALNVKIDALSDEEKSLNAIIDKFEEDRLEKINNLTASYAEADVKSAALVESIHKLSGKLEHVAEKINNYTEKMTELLPVSEGFAKEKETLISGVARFGAIIGAASSSAGEVQDSIRYVSSAIGGDCYMCGTMMTPEGAKKSIAKMLDKLKTIANQKNEADAKCKDLTEQHIEVLAKKRGVDELLENIKAVLKKGEAELDSVMREKSSLEINKVSLDSQMTLIASQIGELKTVTNKEANDRLDKVIGEISIKADKITAAESRKDSLEKKATRAELLEKCLGNTGLKSLIFDQVTPDLNKYANEYLSMIDPGMSVEVSTVTKLKSGEYREKFSIKVDNSTGCKKFVGNSGGEKQKVNLALSLAFNRLMREISGSVPDLIILDEPFESLDAGTSEQVMELLAGLKANNIFLITHNSDIKDLVPNRITATKKHGITSIS